MAYVWGDYYFAVVHPIIYYMTNKRSAKVISVIVWVFIVCFGLIAASNSCMFARITYIPVYFHVA